MCSLSSRKSSNSGIHGGRDGGVGTKSKSTTAFIDGGVDVRSITGSADGGVDDKSTTASDLRCLDGVV